MLSKRLLLVAALWAVPHSAFAHGASGDTLPKDAPPVTKEGETAKASVVALEGDPKKLKIASKAVGKARKALSRAHGAKLSNDAEGARLLSGVALAWSKSAEAAVRAAETLAAADALSTSRAELTQKLTRAKMLLAEHDARRQALLATVRDAEKIAAERKAAKPDAIPGKGPTPKKAAPPTKPDPNPKKPAAVPTKPAPTLTPKAP